MDLKLQTSNRSLECNKSATSAVVSVLNSCVRVFTFRWVRTCYLKRCWWLRWYDRCYLPFRLIPFDLPVSRIRHVSRGSSISYLFETDDIEPRRSLVRCLRTLITRRQLTHSITQRFVVTPNCFSAELRDPANHAQLRRPRPTSKVTASELRICV